MKSKSLIAAGVLFGLMGVLVLAHAPGPLTVTFRWLGVAALFVYGWACKSNTTWIMVCLVAGGCLGHDVPATGVYGRMPSLIFIRLVKSIIAPLIFAMLVRGIAQQSDIKRTGRLTLKAIIYFEVVSTIALVLGLAAINISKAGVGINLKGAHQEKVQVTKVDAQELVLNAFPENIAKAVADGKVLQVIIFAVLFGLGLALCPEDKRAPVLTLCDSIAQVMFKFTKVVMMFAPIAVGGAMAYTIGHMGLGVLYNLGKLLATLYVALICFVLFILLPIVLAFRLPLRRLMKVAAQPCSIAFATTASEAAMPTALKNLEEFGVSRRVCSFVYPLGMSFNQDGASIYIALATIFVAQTTGIHMSFGTQLVLLLTLMLMTKGMTGVPRGSLIYLMAASVQFGLPLEPIFIIMGIDELMDMPRTALNVLGNCVATTVVAKWENDFHLTPEGEPAALADSAAAPAAGAPALLTETAPSRD
jgi:proton glutamate symport protein